MILNSRRSIQPGGAFTLLEVLMVTSVVAMLTSIMLPSFRKAREETRRTVCVAHLKNIGVALFTYGAENKDNGPMVMAPLSGGTSAPRNLISTPGGLVNMGLMLPIGMKDPKAFLCPSQVQFEYPHALERLGQELVGSSYAYAVNVPAQKSPKLGSIRHLALASDDFVAPDGDFGIGKYAHRAGYNVLYTDGSATWYADGDESIWKRKVRWDDETDAYNYASLYRRSTTQPATNGRQLDIFRVWYSFCYARPDPFPG